MSFFVCLLHSAFLCCLMQLFSKVCFRIIALVNAKLSRWVSRCYALLAKDQHNCLPVFLFFLTTMDSLSWVFNTAHVKRSTLCQYKHTTTVTLNIHVYWNCHIEGFHKLEYVVLPYTMCVIHTSELMHPYLSESLLMFPLSSLLLPAALWPKNNKCLQNVFLGLVRPSTAEV